MCKEVEDYAKERETIKGVKMVKNLLEEGIKLETALKCADIDEATFNEYKDKV